MQHVSVESNNCILLFVNCVMCSGLMCSNELTEVLHELTSPHMGSNVLPEPWMHITPSQVHLHSKLNYKLLHGLLYIFGSNCSYLISFPNQPT